MARSRTPNDPQDKINLAKAPPNRPVAGMTEREIEEGFTPFDDRVLVRLDRPITRTAKGILVPQESVPEPRMGTIVRQGPGYLMPDGDGKARALMCAKPGDRILFERAAGVTLPRSNIHLLIRDGSIVGVVKRRGDADAKFEEETVEDDVVPTQDWVLAQLDQAPEKMGRFILPESLRLTRQTVEEHPGAMTGVIRKVGPGLLCKNGRDRAELQARVGDRVAFVEGSWEFQTIPGVGSYAMVRLVNCVGMCPVGSSNLSVPVPEPAIP